MLESIELKMPSILKWKQFLFCSGKLFLLDATKDLNCGCRCSFVVILDVIEICGQCRRNCGCSGSKNLNVADESGQSFFLHS